jgi:cytoskeletal protein CcmA (bactofilin family)
VPARKPAVSKPAGRAGAGNVYLAGAAVVLDRAVTGDLYAAGGNVRVDHEVGEDAVLAGGNVAVTAPVGDDLRAAGGSVALDASVGGEVLAAGGSVVLGAHSAIAGPARICGGDVAVSGRVERDLSVDANTFVLDGTVAGSAHLTGERIRLARGARIAGRLTYASREPIEIDREARVGGEIVREALPKRPLPQPERRDAGGGWLAGLWWLGILAAGIVLVLIFPGFTTRTEAAIAARPWPVLGLGAAVVFASPVIMLLAALTIVGLPLALLAGTLYAAALFAGYLVAADCVGMRAVKLASKLPPDASGPHVAGVATGVILLGLTAFVPVLGCIVALLAELFGVGALVLEFHRGKHRPETVLAPAPQAAAG